MAKVKPQKRYKITFNDGRLPEFLSKKYQEHIFDAKSLMWIFYDDRGKTVEYSDDVVESVTRK